MAINHISKEAYLTLNNREARLNAWIKQHPGNNKDVPACDFAWCDGELISFPNTHEGQQKLYEAYFKRRFKEIFVPSRRDWRKGPVEENKTESIRVTNIRAKAPGEHTKPSGKSEIVVRVPPSKADRTLKMTINVPKLKSEKPPMRFNKTICAVPVGYRATKLTPHELFMYKILDDIDTASDIAKSNDKLFRALVKRQIAKFKDGYMFCCDGETVKKIVPTKAYADKWNRKLDEMMADYT